MSKAQLSCARGHSRWAFCTSCSACLAASVIVSCRCAIFQRMLLFLVASRPRAFRYDVVYTLLGLQNTAFRIDDQAAATWCGDHGWVASNEAGHRCRCPHQADRTEEHRRPRTAPAVGDPCCTAVCDVAPTFKVPQPSASNIGAAGVGPGDDDNTDDVQEALEWCETSLQVPRQSARGSPFEAGDPSRATRRAGHWWREESAR